MSSPGEAAIRVAKIGGSLLAEPHLAERLQQWFSRADGAQWVLLCGGGTLVDALGDWQQRQRIDDEPIHWLCVRTLSITARLLQAIAPEWPLCSNFAELSSDRSRARMVIGDPAQWVSEQDRVRGPSWLPHDWTVTSDSIAARLAEVLGADELVLFKSALPREAERRRAAEAGFVDAFFPTASQRVPRVRCVNLRDSAMRECVLR